MDVTGWEPWSLVVCAACGETVRVRRAFHHFKIMKEVGLGGMSRVFGARDESLGRDLALKILHQGLSQDEKRLHQFEREARITANISHPNVVKVYTAGRDQGYFYIAMELVEGGSLDEKMRIKGRLPEGWILEMAEHVVLGLEAANEAGLIHRDIKPGNILLPAEGTAKIVDFGLAVFTREGVDDSEIWATPYYVPPETLHGEPEDFRSDIYALGSSLYHALVGKPLFNSDSNSLSALKILKSKPADLKEAAAILSPETVAILARTLKRKTADRYGSYREFLDHLRYARRRLSRGGKGAPWPGRQGLSARQWTAAAALVALSAAGIWNWWDSRPGPGSGLVAGGILTLADATSGTDSTVSTKFLAAREVLYQGDFRTARQQFCALAADAAVRQPTLNWARYNAGLAALFAGDITAARSQFASFRSTGGDSNHDPATAGFFLKSAIAIDNDEIVPASHLAECPPDSVQAIGLLAAGLKNWHLGDLSGSSVFLSAFAASVPPRTAAWVDRYKQPAQPWLDGAKILHSLPSLPLKEITAGAAASRLAQATGLLAALPPQSGVKDAIEAKLNEVAAAIDQLKQSQGTVQTSAMQAQTTMELEAIMLLESQAGPFGLKLEFNEGSALLRRGKAGSPLGKEFLADRLNWWEKAESFLDVLTSDLAVPIEGVIDRRLGSPVRGLISASDQGLKIKPSAGPESVLPFTSCTASSLATLAERLIERTADSDEYYRRRELLVAFAMHSGLKTYAAVAGGELAREHPGFRERWDRGNPVP